MKTTPHKQDNSAISAAAGAIRGIGDNFPPIPTTIEELKALPAELVYDLDVSVIVAIATAEAAIGDVDLSTAAGRALVKSKAHDVSKLKTNLVDKGLSLTAGWREETKKVNAIKGDLETKLDALRDATRAPVTEWEANDEARIKGHQDAFKSVQDMMLFPSEISSSDVQLRIDTMKTLSERNWEEFEASATIEIGKVCLILGDKLVSVQKSEADAKELEQLRQAAAAQKQKEEEAEAARVQAEKDKKAEDDKQALIEQTRKDTEARLAKEREEAEIKRKNILTGGILSMKNLLEGASDLPSSALAGRKETVTNIYKSISDWQEFSDDAKKVNDDVFGSLDHLYALNLKKEKEEQARKNKEISDRAAETERARIKAKQDAEQAELEKRESNKRHVAKINKETAEAIHTLAKSSVMGLTAREALEIVEAISRGEIPHVQINY